MKIVVIGGTGLIGSKLVERLRENGHELLAACPRRASTPSRVEGLVKAHEVADVVVADAKRAGVGGLRR